MHRAIFGRGSCARVLIPYGIITVVAAFAWQFAFDPTTGFVDQPAADPRHGAAFGDHAGSLLVIIMAEVWKTTPFMALLLLAGLALVPDELYEAAKVDGASAWQRFFRITLPLMKPAILVALLFRTLDAFRVFDIDLHHRPGVRRTPRSVSILGYNQLISRLNLGLGSAVSVLIFLCVILIAFVFVKGFGASTAQQRGEPEMSTRPREDASSGAIGIVVVLLFALIPVLWLVSLSLKTPDADRRRQLLPVGVTFDNYKTLFEGRRHVHQRADQLDRDRADRHGDRDHPRLVRRLRDRPARVPGQAR